MGIALRLLLLLLLLAPTLAPAQATDSAVPDLVALIAQPQSELRAVLERWNADQGALGRRYAVEYSPERRARLRQFNTAWRERLRAIVPGWEGAYSVKWLTHLQVSARDHDGPFVQAAYRYPRRPVRPGATVAPAEMQPVQGLFVKSLITSPMMPRSLNSV